MPSNPRIKARITFLSPEGGGRSQPAYDSPKYRPHIVIGAPSQRQPVFADDGKTILEDYLGVRFTGNGTVMTPGREYELELELLYCPEVDYSALQRGVTFTIREGGDVVGFGEVEHDPWGTA